MPVRGFVGSNTLGCEILMDIDPIDRPSIREKIIRLYIFE